MPSAAWLEVVQRKNKKRREKKYLISNMKICFFFLFFCRNKLGHTTTKWFKLQTSRGGETFFFFFFQMNASTSPCCWSFKKLSNCRPAETKNMRLPKWIFVHINVKVKVQSLTALSSLPQSFYLPFSIFYENTMLNIALFASRVRSNCEIFWCCCIWNPQREVIQGYTEGGRENIE